MVLYRLIIIANFTLKLKYLRMKRDYSTPQAMVYGAEAAEPLAASATGGTANPLGRDAGDGGMFPSGLDFNDELPW